MTELERKSWSGKERDPDLKPPSTIAELMTELQTALI